MVLHPWPLGMLKAPRTLDPTGAAGPALAPRAQSISLIYPLKNIKQTNNPNEQSNKTPKKSDFESEPCGGVLNAGVISSINHLRNAVEVKGNFSSSLRHLLLAFGYRGGRGRLRGAPCCPHSPHPSEILFPWIPEDSLPRLRAVRAERREWLCWWHKHGADSPSRPTDAIPVCG